ncbi:MAG TPA: acetyl-CoA carboxylase biotin carboxylase subunit [Armatimonadota bacterium]|jgi:acetyl-CoA carboxylase biotin carboxylase subunit
MFSKLLIAARGEIAVRIIRACREMGISTVAVYSQADQPSLHVSLADEAVCVGPPPGKDSYLNMSNIVSAALITGAEAVHPGCGFLAENASFAELCQACGLVWVGPSPRAMEEMGNKARAREIAEDAGIPTIPGTKGAISGESDALKFAKRHGYPLGIKAAAGGGGKGIRVVLTDDDLLPSLQAAQTEAQAAFGDSSVYLEKWLESPRHIEVQVLGDEHGTVLHLGERQCSVQSRNQKLLEEAPFAGLPGDLRARIAESAVKVARAAGYSNAGTVEFLMDRQGGYYFMEMNTRIQVEHPVTEAITGLDLVKLQIAVAAGEPMPLQQSEVRFLGHAIECRINAADPDRNFAPCPGPVGSLRLPGGLGVRIDTHLYAGYEIPPYYDSLVAKLITWGQDRDEAIARMLRSLDELQVGDRKTTIPLHRRILNSPRFRANDVSTSFLETLQ